jgi:pimeloyl-ACP methyl ester carboxylesterase
MVEERYADVGGRKLRYLVAGAGWPMVLIHGFPLHAGQWRPQLDDVPDGWQFIAPDLRGFGPGASPPRDSDEMTIDDYASDVEGLLDQMEIDRAFIGGLSMGGYVTFALFRRAPERFTGMLLADTRPQADTPEERQGRRGLLELVRKNGVSAIMNRMFPKLLGKTTFEERPGVVRRVESIIKGGSVEAIEGGIHALISRPDSTPDLARISTPALVIVGDEDVITPVSDGELLHRSIGRSRLVTLPAAGHLSNLETPEAFSRALHDFLTSNL